VTFRDTAPRSADVVIIGSGLVGACCADELSAVGLSVVVVDRGNLTSGTTASGEGNILVSDKPPGPELDLARLGRRRWIELADEIGTDIEFDEKGGVVVADDDASAAGLARLAAEQRSVGIQAIEATGDDLQELEPHIAPGLTLGMYYPEDCQVQPVLASAALLRRARGRGAAVLGRTVVTAIEVDAVHRVRAVVTTRGTIATPWVVNAAGPWSGEVAALAGLHLPIEPRRGHILVTEPRGTLIRHKVYDADYVGTLTADPGDAQVSAVVEGTRSGTILLGSSREFVGWDRQVDGDLVRRIGARAVQLFPILADIKVMRTYVGFRPWLPDHLPAIGEEPSVPGFIQATGHEGAGIGLAPATGLVVRDLVTERTLELDITAFRPDRPSLHPPARTNPDPELTHG
jgi:D-hydroxyproline dehydrogenase subunit beta